MQKSILTVVFLLSIAFSLFAQNASSDTTMTIPKKKYFTKAVSGTPPAIDGHLDDACWGKVEWGTEFTQSEPYDGGEATQETTFRILYDDKNLYVAFRCFDSAPDSIVRRMSRRDGFEGDWVEINIDSYHDKRTAFSFTSSVSGVKGDEFISENGNNWDVSWNPIWFVKTNIDDLGWTAEVRIPLSQLRFANKEEHIWGIQITRRNYRKEARSIWQYIPRTSGYWVSGFGELHGIKGIKSQKQVEVQPYVVAKAETFEKQEGNPFASGSDTKLTVGVDGKIGITSDLILDFTINPDFGQVEADPSVLTLDGFRVFFDERRPFFIESRNIFRFQASNAFTGGPFVDDNLFYSRRIGSSPHAYPSLNENEYAKVPENTSILGAAKFSGKTQKGLSIGILESVTEKEMAEIDYNGVRREEVVEPLTSFFVSRIQQDFDDGNTVVGGILTAVNRNLNDTGLDYLHRSAYSGGLDFLHKWKEQTYQLEGKVFLSQVNGSEEAILNTQTAFEHYYQRPDAEHLEVDSSATSLLGHGGTLTMAKLGGNLKFQGGVTWRSPGLELNDVGFMRNADEINHFFWAGYRTNNPFLVFRELGINYNHWSNWDFGGNHLYQAFNTNFRMMFKNFWGGGTGFTFETKDISNNALFGGPTLRKPHGIGQFLYAFTDRRKMVSFQFNMSNGWGKEKAVRNWSYGIGMQIQPTNAFNISLRPSLSKNQRQIQSVGSAEFEGEARYLAGSVDQRTLSMTLRLNYTITPNLTLQFYGQPFISQGQYDEFKYITDPMAKVMNKRFHQYTEEEITFDSAEDIYRIDENQDGVHDYTVGNPDFSFIQFRSNLVARWEYIPGSELYLVWSQGTTNSGDPEEALFPNLTDNLFTNKAHNIFLLKLTYRFTR
ncbi:MAG: carbohydrate binding family 9 domain-containing protein [Bacteroidetes bacterium]|nr:carbohydrate binding family 9 domain-containing protein [Bacteroidota bacterium]